MIIIVVLMRMRQQTTVDIMKNGAQSLLIKPRESYH
jgi:hypothetical protein